MTNNFPTTTRGTSGKYAIDRPCSACSAGDSAMEFHDHQPPFREGCGPEPLCEKCKKPIYLDADVWRHKFGKDWVECGDPTGEVMGRIESGIPAPKRTNGKPFKWDFLKMKIGDSMLLPKNSKAASSHAARHPEFAFVTRTEGKYLRVWRVEPRGRK